MKNIILSLSIILCYTSIFANPLTSDPTFEGTYIPQKNISHKLVGTNPNTYTPKYVQIKGYRECLSTKSMGTWKEWCLPKNKPTLCDDSAWKDLKHTSITTCNQDNR